MGKKDIGIFREAVERFAPQIASRYPSLKDAIAATPHEHKELILDYLRNGDVYMVTTGPAIDDLTGESLTFSDCGRCDDDYEWGDLTAYYVDRYNLRLPQEFVDHILRKSGVA